MSALATWLWPACLLMLTSVWGKRMREWGGWDWVAYSALWIAAIILAADSGIKDSEKLKESFSVLLQSTYWSLSPLVLVVFGTCVFILKHVGWIGLSTKKIDQIPLSVSGTSVLAIKKISEIATAKIPTSLRMQFRGGQQAPTEVRAENILSWYVVWTGHGDFAFRDKDNKVLQEIKLPRTWVIFLVFDNPVTMRQLIVQPAAQNFPRYEIKIVTTTYAVITTFGEDPPPGILDIYTKD